MARLPRFELAALAGLLVLAAALRATGIRYGLPFGNLLNPDEQSIVPRAWLMTHGGGLDPKWFDYPTLLMYVLAPLEWLFDEPSYLAARIVALLFGVGGVAAAWWLGRAAYGASAGLITAAAVAVDATHVAYSRMAVTDVPMTTAATVSLALLVRGRLMWAAAAAGVATGFKYPAVFLLVPIAVAWWREPGRVVRAWALAGAVFVACSPFVLIRWWSGASDDVARVQRLAREGWLGFEDDPPTALAFLDRLWDGQGPFLALGLAGLAYALWRHTRVDLVLASFVLAYYANLLTIDAHYARYMLPLVPVLGAFAGRALWDMAVWFSSRRDTARRPRDGDVHLHHVAAALALLVPLFWAVSEAAERTRTDTRVVAQRRLLELVPPGASIAAEPSTPSLGDRYVVVPLELPGPGRPHDENRDYAFLREAGLDYVFVTGAVADRVLAARGRYARDASFYDDLRTRARRMVYVEPGSGLAGPWVALYRIE